MASDALSLIVSEPIKCCNCGCSCAQFARSSALTWNRSVKRKFELIEEAVLEIPAGLDYARVEIENECQALRETLSSQQQSIQELYSELEEERNASASAANEAMSMILRLQREKAEIQMEARQFKRFAEEKMAHDQQELVALEDLLYKKDQMIQAITCEAQSYKHRMLSFGLTEEEVEGENREKGFHSRSQSISDVVGEKGLHSRNHSLNEISENQYDLPTYDYPPLKCNLYAAPGPYEAEEETADVEKYAFGETPRPFGEASRAAFGETPRPFGEAPRTAFGETTRVPRVETPREHLQNLEYRICQLERTPRSQVDGELFGSKTIFEKSVVGQSPRRSRHVRRFSSDSSSSLYGMGKEVGLDSNIDYSKPGTSFKKMECFTLPEEYPNPRHVDDASDVGDDMSDRVYTVDSIHNGAPNNNFTVPKASLGIYDDYMNTPRESFNRGEIEDPDIKKLYMRLQALEADRESMKQAIISMRTDKAQLVLLREIAQHLYRDMSPERKMPVKKASPIGSISLMSVVKWVVSFVFWRKKAHRSKYMFGLTPNNVGLLLLLDKTQHMSRWRCLNSAQMRDLRHL